MMDRDALKDARQLEDIQFNQWMSEASVEANSKIQASERSLAARGLALSGVRFKAQVDIIFDSIQGVVEKVIAYRRELGARVPALLEPSNLRALKEKLDHYVEGGVNGVRQRLAHQPRGVGGSVFVQEADSRARALKARLSQKLAALPLEARLGIHQGEESRMTTTFNISNSTIANLNLGSVVGDLNSSIQQLSSDGRNDLAEALKRMTEAVASSPELDDAIRKEVLEHVAVVSSEAALPPEKRKMGPLKTSIEAIKAGIGLAAQLLTLWQGVEHALKSAGLIHG